MSRTARQTGAEAATASVRRIEEELDDELDGMSVAVRADYLEAVAQAVEARRAKDRAG